MTMRLGDLAQTQKTMANLLALKTRISQTQATIDSGKQSGTLAGYGAKAASLLALRAQNSRIGAYIDQNTIVQARLQVMDSAMESVGAVAGQLQTLLVARRNGATDNSATVDQEIDQMLQSVQSALNAQYNGQYLFAGSTTNKAPVSLSSPASTGSGDTSYYSGDDVIASVQADDDIQLSYGVTAANPAFANLIWALSAAKSANSSGSDADLAAALSLAENSVSELSSLRSISAITTGSLDSINDTLKMNEVYFGNLGDDIENTDLSVAIAKVSADSVALEAAYATMSKVSSLSLVDYIR